MPIQKHLRKHYGKHWREVVRPRILARAENKCEQCRVPNYEIIGRHKREFPGWWFSLDGYIHANDGTVQGIFRGSEEDPDDYRFIKIILTVAHLNHVSGDDRDENLRALCQWCHLNYDQDHHKQSRIERKDAARTLLNSASMV